MTIIIVFHNKKTIEICDNLLDLNNKFNNKIKNMRANLIDCTLRWWIL